MILNYLSDDTAPLVFRAFVFAAMVLGTAVLVISPCALAVFLASQI